jgi:ATP-dependent Clp protease ATP-binding subunit ClpC
MNDAATKALKVVVERAVRPVRATIARKRRMREELLAHLMAIFEEEYEKTGDEQAALDQARARFGDPRELSGRLQQTAPQWERLVAIADRLLDLQPGQSLWHLAGKYVLATLAAFIVVLPLPVLSMIVRGRQGEIATTIRTLFVFALMFSVLSVPFLVAPYRIGRLLYGADSERSLRRAVWYGLVSLAIFPALAFGTYWALTGDLAASLVHLRFACLFAPAAPVFIFTMARRFVEEIRHKEEWASLEIDS